MKDNLTWEVHGTGVRYAPRRSTHAARTIVGWIALAVIMWAPTFLVAALLLFFRG